MESYGWYTLAILLPTMMATVLNLGLAPATIYLVGSKTFLPRDAFSSNLRAATMLSVFGVVLSAFIVHFFHSSWFPGVPAKSLYLAIVGVPTALFLSLNHAVVHAKREFAWLNRVSLAPTLVNLGVVPVFIILLDWGVMGAIGAYVLGQAIGAVLPVKRLLSDKKSASFQEARLQFRNQALSYGLRAHPSTILNIFNYRLDMILLGAMAGSIEVGIYAVAVLIAERLRMLSAAVSTVLLPTIASMADKEDERRALTCSAARITGLLTVAGALGVGVLSQYLIVPIFGDAYRQSATALVLLLPGIVLHTWGAVFGNDLAARGKPELNAWIAALNLSINVAANLLLIPDYGILGASIATSLSYSAFAIASAIAYLHVTKQSKDALIRLNRFDKHALDVTLKAVGRKP